MAAIVCRGLQSYNFESQLVESRTSTTFRLTLPLSKSLPPPSPPQPKDLTFKSKTRYSEEISGKTDTGGWSFLQALSDVRHDGLKELSEKESIYVHPQTKRSSLILSERSLQLCTENLGNETGTDIVGKSIDLLCSSWENGSAGDCPTREQTRAARPVLGGKKERTQNFPPPLTTIRGSESLRVRPHREEGRLVIEAVRVTSSASCFKAERSHGRLRLCLLKNQSTRFDYEDGDTDETEEIESEVEEEEEDDEDEEYEELRVEMCERPIRCKELLSY